MRQKRGQNPSQNKIFEVIKIKIEEGMEKFVKQVGTILEANNYPKKRLRTLKEKEEEKNLPVLNHKIVLPKCLLNLMNKKWQSKNDKNLMER